MAKPLDDLQLILLSCASQRDDMSLMPLRNAGADKARITRAINALLRRKLIEAQPVSDASQTWRGEGDERSGLFLTAAGRAALGVEEDAGGEVGAPSTPETLPEPAIAPARQTKVHLVLDLLTRDEGATLADLVTATGWLPHTTRAALTGLRKKGHAITKDKRDGVTCYHVSAA